jgi:hypothetical protein
MGQGLAFGVSVPRKGVVLYAMQRQACAGRILSSAPVVTGFSLPGQSPKGIVDSEWLIVERMSILGQDTPSPPPDKMPDSRSARLAPHTMGWR